MAEERVCAHCGASFRVNPGARDTHRYCARESCQRERQRLAQRTRRQAARASATTREESPRPSTTWRRERAAYMRKYRKSHPAYRERERRRRRREVEAGSGVVTEAGSSSQEPARVYLVTDPESGIRLRVVTATGRSVTVRAEAASEAGYGAVAAVTTRAAGGVVTEAG
jgi:hypothetical protein